MLGDMMEATMEATMEMMISPRSDYKMSA